MKRLRAVLCTRVARTRRLSSSRPPCSDCLDIECSGGMRSQGARWGTRDAPQCDAAREGYVHPI